MSSPLMIIVAADKGGVGKTTVARVLLDYAARKGTAVRAFDTEPGAGVLKRFYPAAESLAIETVPGQMRIVDSASSEAVTLVDARAGMMTSIIKAFGKINLLEDVRNGVLRLVIFHVVGPTFASGSEFEPVAIGFAGAKVVHVRNWTKDDSRFAPQPPGAVLIDFPCLNEEAYLKVDSLGVGYAGFTKDPQQSRTLRGYVVSWEADCFAGLDKSGLGTMLTDE